MKTACTVTHLRRAAAAAGALLLASFAGAVDAVLVENSGGANRYDGTVGFRFQVGPTDLLVTEIGALNIDAAFGTKPGGLGGEVPWAVWNDGGGLVAMGDLAAGTGAGERWAFADVPDFQLLAGQFYRIGIVLPVSGFDYYRDVGSATPAMFDATGGLVSGSFSSRYSDASGLNFPDGAFVVAGDAYTGPNLRYTPVPEPSVLALLAGAGALAFAALRRRR